MMKANSPHIEFAEMADIVTGHLSESETGIARDHIRTCDECGLQFSRLERLVGVMLDDRSADAPTYAIANAFRAYDAYRPPVARSAEAPSLIERVSAALRLDSASLSPSFGTRSDSTASQRQLLYQGGDIDFDIRIAPAERDRWRISGQLLNSLQSGEMELVGVADDSFRAALDSQFRFSFPPVPAGVYKLKFYSANIEIDIPDIAAGL